MNKPTYAELASALRTAHALLGRLPARVFAALPAADLDVIDAAVRHLDAPTGPGKKARRVDPLMADIRAVMAMDGPPENQQ